MASEASNEILQKIENESHARTGRLDLSGARLATQDKLTSVPDEVFGLEHLQHLSLNYNRLTSIPCNIRQLPNLISLVVSDNQITSLPDDLFTLGQLQRLSLSSNRLTSISSEIQRLKSLETLLVAHNQLTSLPDSLGELLSLRNLSIQGNPFHAVPDCVFRLTLLDTLSAGGKGLKISPALANLVNLQTLRLENIGLERLVQIPDNQIVTRVPVVRGAAVAQTLWSNKEVRRPGDCVTDLEIQH
jgi:Leucine-rich repeat (LRR) protein